MALSVKVNKSNIGSRPEHHTMPAKKAATWPSYLPWSETERQTTTPPTIKTEATGFRNPWPSFHRPTAKQVWDALQWGDDKDPCIALGASHVGEMPPPDQNPKTRPNFDGIEEWPRSKASQAAALLRLEAPDFAFDATRKTARVTWLGHAGILLQLRPLGADGGQPLRCLFDPIFSMRCSPSQMAGPVRAYPPPCKVEDLPQVDVVFISHNHYDHLDFDTIMALWKRDGDRVSFVVPMGNKQWFMDCGIWGDRVTELDWWDSADLTPRTGQSQGLKVWCTPAQHSSGRSGLDTDSTLWSGWYLEHPGPKPFRVFFAGDTGYQFHESPDWPPPPPPTAVSLDPGASGKASQKNANGGYATCPAFAEIRTRLGPPNLLLLPIAVGSTYAYLRSYVPLPDWISPFPRHAPGLTAAVHTPAWDALRVLRLLTADEDGGGSSERQGQTVAIAIHWGTFVTEATEVLKTLGQLEWACHQHGVRFARTLPVAGETSDDAAWGESCFLAMNHGQSISM